MPIEAHGILPRAARRQGRAGGRCSLIRAMALLVVLSLASGTTPAEERDCDGAWAFGTELELPNQERRAESNLDLVHFDQVMSELHLGDTGNRTRICVHLKGTGLVKLDILLQGRNIAGTASAAEINRPWGGGSVDGGPMHMGSSSQWIFQDVLVLDGETPVDRLLEIAVTSEFDHMEENDPRGYELLVNTFRLTIRMERIAPQCVMAANVTGDVRGNFFGDVAYFNARKEAVQEGMMAGTLADEEMHEQLQDLVEGMAAMAQMAEEMGFDTGLTNEQKGQLGMNPDGSTIESATNESIEARKVTKEALEEMLRPEPGDAGDNFGLSLTDAHTRSLSEFELIAPGAAMSDAFTLTVSGLTSAWPENPAQGETVAVNVGVSAVTMTAGLSDRRGAIKFELDEDATFDFRVDVLSNDFVWGTLETELVTKSVYSQSSEIVARRGAEGFGLVSETPRKLRATVSARFFAARGFSSCMDS